MIVFTLYLKVKEQKFSQILLIIKIIQISAFPNNFHKGTQLFLYTQIF